MKEDVIAANLANLRQSVNELKETVNKLNVGSQNHEQTAQSPIDERTVYNSVAKSFCNCWNDALSVLKKSMRKEQPDKIPFSRWIPKLIDLLKQIYLYNPLLFVEDSRILALLQFPVHQLIQYNLLIILYLQRTYHILASKCILYYMCHILLN